MSKEQEKEVGEISVRYVYDVQGESYGFVIFDAVEDKEMASVGFATYFMEDGKDKDDMVRRMISSIAAQVFEMLVGHTKKDS